MADLPPIARTSQPVKSVRSAPDVSFRGPLARSIARSKQVASPSPSLCSLTYWIARLDRRRRAGGARSELISSSLREENQQIK